MTVGVTGSPSKATDVDERRTRASVDDVLSRKFYARPAVEVAPDLIGMYLMRTLDGQCLGGRIVETEAYMGADDPASHAFRGPTPRNRSMFGPPGHLYVYRSYGIHYCANVVTSDEGVGTAVLIRALEPVEGIDVMQRLRGVTGMKMLCSGPGKVCQALAITTKDDSTDLNGDEIRICGPRETGKVLATPRIGIGVAQDRLWRFVEAGSAYLSRSVRS